MKPTNKTFFFPGIVRSETISGSISIIGGGTERGADLLINFFSDPKVRYCVRSPLMPAKCTALATSVVWETASGCWDATDSSVKELSWNMMVLGKTVTSLGFTPSQTRK